MQYRTRKAPAAIAMAAMATGCTVGSYHVPPNLIIDPAKPPREKLGQAAKDNAVTTTPRGTDGTQPQASQPLARQTVAEKFLQAYRESYEDDRTPEKARALTRYGMTVIDTRCDLFFEQIGRGAQGGDFLRREFQSLSAALIAALGLTNIGKDAITGVGIGTALGTQTIDNYSTVYFFSPDVSSVQQLVRRAFTSLRTSLLSAEQSPNDFDEAIGALRTYQNVCTAHEIKRLVTAAIDKGQAVAQYGNADGPRYAAAADRALDEMARALGLETLSPREAALLQILSALTIPADAEKVDYVCSVLSKPVQDLMCDKSTVSDGGVTLDVMVPKANTPDAKTAETLRADWATLRALGDTGYTGEVTRQSDVIASVYKDYRASKMEKARLRVELATAHTKPQAEIRALNDQLVIANERLAKAAATSAIVSEQAVPSAPVTGVTVVNSATGP